MLAFPAYQKFIAFKLWIMIQLMYEKAMDPMEHLRKLK